MECDTGLIDVCPGCKNFNSRTHVECDIYKIHCRSNENQFQLTHSRGVRPSSMFSHPFRISFQLTHSRGVRRLDVAVLIAAAEISTHALTWSATGKFVCRHQRCWNFNSRTHVECDLKYLCIALTPQDFNSRTHVECDCYISKKGSDLMDFNSRTHVECDKGTCRR